LLKEKLLNLKKQNLSMQIQGSSKKLAYKCAFLLALFIFLGAFPFNAFAGAFSCTGMVDGNAEMYPNDDAGLTADVPKTLVENNSSAKCEWHCKTGFVRLIESCVKQTVSPVLNSIIDFNAVFDGSTKITASHICNASILGAKITLEESTTPYSAQRTIGCNVIVDKTEIIDSKLPIGKTMQLTLTIPQPCEVCSKTIFLALPEPQKEKSIPDYSILSILALLAIVMLCLRKKE
jgi:hypothetical protein